MTEPNPPTALSGTDAPDRLHPREAMLRAAIRLFRARGYEGVGVADLLEASGAPRGSLYFHFPGGKEQIARESMARAGELDSARYRALQEKSATLDAFLQGLFEGSAAGLERSDFERGCGVGLITLETAATSKPLHEAAAGVLAQWRRDLARTFQSYGLTPEAAASLAEATLGALQGAIILARAQRSTAPFASASAMLRAAAKAWPNEKGA
jgi:TetR/AcrR family transcriptional regulator, lmrAB and yxaGH operons repressor